MIFGYSILNLQYNLNIGIASFPRRNILDKVVHVVLRFQSCNTRVNIIGMTEPGFHQLMVICELEQTCSSCFSLKLEVSHPVFFSPACTQNSLIECCIILCGQCLNLVQSTCYIEALDFSPNLDWTCITKTLFTLLLTSVTPSHSI